MAKITRASLWSLEAYAKERDAFRTKVMAHKKTRKLFIGEHVMLDFEDELTVRYQIHEMLRAERTFEEQGILDEIEAYAPLVPDGRNFKATMLIEYPEVDERRRELAKLIGIAEHVWLQVKGCAKVFAIADEDSDRNHAAPVLARDVHRPGHRAESRQARPA